MLPSPDRIIAPWSPKQVESLNQYQKEMNSANRYNCGFRGTSHRPLVATERFLMCIDCEYKTHWVYGIAVDESWREYLQRSNIRKPYWMAF